MAPRTRTVTFSTPKGDARNRAGTVFLGGGTVTSGSSTCSDQTKVGDCAPFTVDRWSYAGCLLHKEYDSGSSISTQFHNYVPDAFSVDATWPHISVPGLLDYATYATRAVARTNPSRPYVDIPANVLELGDIVRMIKDVGQGLIFDARDRTRGLDRHVRNVARTNLLYRFGIAPVVGDLVKLTRFSEQVDNRIQEIQRLRGPKGLRRTVTLDSSGASSSKLVVMQSSLAGTNQPRATWTGMTGKQIRAHVRWKPSIDLSHLSPGAMREMASNSVLGITSTYVDLATLWQVYPWSWAIDWFSNVGDFLAANRNIVPASLDGCWIIEETLTEWTTPNLVWAFGTGTMDSGSFYRVQKKRSSSVPPAPTAHFPFLNGNQVGILTSLSLLRR